MCTCADDFDGSALNNDDVAADSLELTGILRAGEIRADESIIDALELAAMNASVPLKRRCRGGKRLPPLLPRSFLIESAL